MPGAARLLTASLCFGAAAGALIGFLDARFQHYPQQGLAALTLELVAAAASAYLAAAFAGGVAAALLCSVETRLARRGGRVARLLGPLAWLVALAPVWVLLPVRDRELLAPDVRVVIAGYALGVLLHGVAFYALVRRRSAGALARSGGRGWLAAAALPVLAVAGLVTAVRLGLLSPASDGPRPNLLIVVLDTVRADRLSCYGYARPTTPELDAFARNAIRYTQFYATSSWTIPSHASLFTGLYPLRHRATQENLMLGREFVTLAELLRNAGYRTWGASGNPYVGPDNRLSQGFAAFVETWRDDPRAGGDDSVPHPNNSAFEAFLRHAGRDRPFYAFVNYMDAHLPYAPPGRDLRRFLRRPSDGLRALRVAQKSWTHHYVDEPFSERDLQLLSDLYDAELAYASRSVGRLLEMLRRDGRFEDTLIVITSDHGEHFGENELFGHMFGLYNTTVRIPLLLRPPGGLPHGRIDGRKGQLVDLFPTILNAAGVPYDRTAQHGVDLLARESGRDAIFSEYYYPYQVFSVIPPEQRARARQQLAPFQRRLRAIQLDGWRFIWSSNGHHELYDLRGDPGETRNLFDPRVESERVAALAARLERALDAYRDPAVDPTNAASSRAADELADDAQRIEALRSLGYLR